MGWFDGFPFKTHAQMEKERKQFQTKVLPFGEEQKQAALLVLKQVTSQKLHDDERLFAFFSAKDAFIEGLDDGNAPKAALRAIEKQTRLSPQDRQNIVALVYVEHDINSLEAYPTAQEVLAAATKFADLEK